MPHKHKIKGKWTGKWLGQVKNKGVRDRRLFETKAEAIEWEVNQKKGIPEVHPIAPEPETTKTVTVSLADWSNKYLDYSLRYSPKTYSEKKSALKRMIQAFGKDTAVESIKPGQALELLQKQFQERSGYAANKDRKNLGSAWNWGVKFIEGFPNVNPFEKVDKFPQDSHDRYVPPEADYRKVEKAAQGQDKTMLIAFLHTAARRGELYRLKWSDVDFGNQRIRLKTRKRGSKSLEADWVPMTDELFNVLLEHKQNAVNEWVFVQGVGRHKNKPYTENRGFPQELCKTAEVEPFGCHAIRHLTASVLAKKNVPMVIIQQLLRHKKLATTERYVRGMEPVRPYLEVLQGGLNPKRSNTGPTETKRGSGVATS